MKKFFVAVGILLAATLIAQSIFKVGQGGTGTNTIGISSHLCSDSTGLHVVTCVPPTNTPTGTNTPTSTNTPTFTPTLTPTPAATSTDTPTQTPTLTPTFTGTLTATNTPTQTPTPTAVGAGGAAHYTGAAGSEPAGATGDFYWPNNGFVFNRYDTVWANNWGPIYPLRFPPPIVSTITTTQGSNGGSITNVATSVVVSSSSGFPAVPFLVSIDTEDIKVTVVAGTTWTIVRGYNGTTNASHTDGATITLVNWEWVNQGTATVAQTTNNGIFMSTPPSTINVRVYKRLIGGNTSLRVAFLPNMFNSGVGLSWVGIVLRESSTGRLETMAWVPTTGIPYRLVCEYDSSPTVQTFDDLISTTFVQPGPSFFRIDPTGTNMLFYVSTDGQNWIQVLSLAKTTHFSSGPDEWGILVGEYSNVSTRTPAALTLISWLEQ